MSTKKCRKSNVDRKRNVDNVKRRHHETRRKEVNDGKMKLEHEGVRVRVRVWVWVVGVWVGVFHYKFEKSRI